MKLFGLKDENGKEYQITLPDLNVSNCVDNRTFTLGSLSIKPIEKLLQFKTGDWIAFDDYIIRKIFYCIDIEKENLFDDSMNPYHIDYCSKATPQEIESHLKKICDEKYIGERVRCLFTDKPSESKILRSQDEPYDSTADCFWMTQRDCFGVMVYEKGKFAEVVSDKKKLPKTKAEFEDFLTQFSDILGERYCKCGNISNFLNQYED